MGPHGEKVVNAVSRLSRRSAWAVVAALLLGAAAWTAAQQVTLDERLELAPGVWYWTQDVETPRGVARAHIVHVADGQALDAIRILIAPYNAGPYAEGSYVIDLPIDTATLATVKPAWKGAFSTGM